MNAIDNDTLVGIALIAAFIKKSERQTYYLAETGQLPMFKLGGKWHLRKSRYLKHIEALEDAALAAGSAA